MCLSLQIPLDTIRDIPPGPNKTKIKQSSFVIIDLPQTVNKNIKIQFDLHKYTTQGEVPVLATGFRASSRMYEVKKFKHQPKLPVLQWI